MSIDTEDDVKGLAVRKLRESLNLTQKQFWGEVGVSGLRGHRYETGITSSIPLDVRRLVFLHFVIGIPTNAKPEVLRALMNEKLNRHNQKAVGRDLKKAADSLQRAMESLTPDK